MACAWVDRAESVDGNREGRSLVRSCRRSPRMDDDRSPGRLSLSRDDDQGGGRCPREAPGSPLLKPLKGVVPRGRSHRRGHSRGGSRSPLQLRRHSLRSPITGSSRTAIPERSSHPTAPSIGSVCRASTRRASSAACSIARPGPSGWGRSGSTFPAPGATSRGRTRWEPPGTRRRAGFWSATRSPWVRGTARTRSPPTRAHRQTTTRPHAGAQCALPRGKRRSRAHLRARIRLWTNAGGVVPGRRRPSRRGRHRGRADGPPANRHGPRHRGRHGPGAAHPDEG